MTAQLAQVRDEDTASPSLLRVLLNSWRTQLLGNVGPRMKLVHVDNYTWNATPAPAITIPSPGWPVGAVLVGQAKCTKGIGAVAGALGCTWQLSGNGTINVGSVFGKSLVSASAADCFALTFVLIEDTSK